MEFPEEIVDAFTVLTAEHIAIDYRTNVLYLQPLKELEGAVFVATRSGASYTLAVATTPRGPMSPSGSCRMGSAPTNECRPHGH